MYNLKFNDDVDLENSNLDNPMDLVADMNNLNMIPLTLDNDSLLYLQIFYEFNDENKYIILRFWGVNSTNDLKLGEFKAFVKNILVKRVARIFSHKTKFSKIRAYNQSKTIDTNEIFLSNVRGSIESNLLEGPYGFSIQTYRPSGTTKFKLFGLASTFKTIDSNNVNKEMAEGFVAFKTAFLYPLKDDSINLELRCVGIHSFYKRKNNKMISSDSDTHVLDLVTQGMIV